MAKDPASRRGSSGSNHGGSRTVGFVNTEGTEDVKAVSGIVQLMSNLHHNAAAVVTSKVKSIPVFDFRFLHYIINQDDAKYKFRIINTSFFRQTLMVPISFCLMMNTIQLLDGMVL